MTTRRRQEVRRGLQVGDLLGQRIGRRALLTLHFAGDALLGDQQWRPVPCGACGGYHEPSAVERVEEPAGARIDGGGAVCPVESQQRALVREFLRAHKTARPDLEAGTSVRERGS